MIINNKNKNGNFLLHY